MKNREKRKRLRLLALHAERFAPLPRYSSCYIRVHVTVRAYKRVHARASLRRTPKYAWIVYVSSNTAPNTARCWRKRIAHTQRHFPSPLSLAVAYGINV